MHLLIVSCTPRAKERSNTDKILDELRKARAKLKHFQEAPLLPGFEIDDLK